jgi:hypothetical protein
VSGKITFLFDEKLHLSYLLLNNFRTSWHSQPYSKGSYTSIAVGASQEDIENIVQPLYANPHQSKVN